MENNDMENNHIEVNYTEDNYEKDNYKKTNYLSSTSIANVPAYTANAPSITEWRRLWSSGSVTSSGSAISSGRRTSPGRGSKSVPTANLGSCKERRHPFLARESCSSRRKNISPEASTRRKNRKPTTGQGRPMATYSSGRVWFPTTIGAD